MIRIFLIILLSIAVFPQKSNAWVGVWLGLEAGVAVLQGITNELQTNKNSSSKQNKKKSNVICVDENNVKVHNLQFCPPTYKTIYINNDSDINENISSVSSSSNSNTYCRNTKTGAVFKSSYDKCSKLYATEISKSTYDSYYKTNTNSNSNTKYITKKNAEDEMSYVSLDIKNKIRYVSVESLILRTSPAGDMISSLNLNTKLTISSNVGIKKNDYEWVFVSDQSGNNGWVAKRFLSVSKINQEPITNDDTQNIYITKKDNNEDDYNISSLKKDLEENFDKQEENETYKEPDSDIILNNQNSVISKKENIKPIIEFEGPFITNSENILIKGRIIDDSEIMAVAVNDNKNLKANDNGYFEYGLKIPIGENDIYVAAIDEWGNYIETTVRVTRNLDEFLFAQNEVSPLNPFNFTTRQKKDDIAIIIGVKEYKDIPDTMFSDNDAKNFYDYAKNSLGVPPKNIHIFINSEAQLFDLYDLEPWLERNINEKSNIYLFYSGHGMTVDDTTYFLPHDFRRSQIERSAFNKEDYLDSILQYNPNHLYAFFDACFTGQNRDGELLIASAKNINIAVEDKLKDNLTIFNSSKRDEFSADFEDAKHGLFSYFLMKGLEGRADANNDQEITTNELYSYIEENVSFTASSIGLSQNPSLMSSQDKTIIKW